jgi:hypothetical protein
MAEAKAGDAVTLKASTRFAQNKSTAVAFREECIVRVKPKYETKPGQFACITCGEVFANALEAFCHPNVHKLAWWTGRAFEVI